MRHETVSVDDDAVCCCVNVAAAGAVVVVVARRRQTHAPRKTSACCKEPVPLEQVNGLALHTRPRPQARPVREHTSTQTALKSPR